MINHRTDDDFADAWDEEDFPEDADDESTVPCPCCHREILEDSPRCPFCEQWISAEDEAGPHRPLWVMMTALLCLGIAIFWVLRAF
jgi:hypothetical protein